MLREHDRVVLTADVPHQGLQAGDVGTIIHIYSHSEGYEVEFVALDGETIAIGTLRPAEVRPIAHREIAHARMVA
jgi:uncharacterized protein DUF4926